MCSASVFWIKSENKFLLKHSPKPEIIHLPLTKLYIILAKLINPEESPVEDLCRPLEGVEGDVELVVSAEHNQVPHLAAVGAWKETHFENIRYFICFTNFVSQVVRAIVDSQAVKWAAENKTP